MDGSIWLRNLVDRIATRLLREVVGEEADAGIDFETTITKDRLTGAPRLRLDGATKSNVGFSASFLLRAEKRTAREHANQSARARKWSCRDGRPSRCAVAAWSSPPPSSRITASCICPRWPSMASARSGAARKAAVDAKVSPDDDGAVVVSVVSSDATRAAMQRIARMQRGGPGHGAENERVARQL